MAAGTLTRTFRTKGFQPRLLSSIMGHLRVGSRAGFHSSAPVDKNVVVAMDGTWNSPVDETNVVRLARHLMGHGFSQRPSYDEQVVSYIEGIGVTGDDTFDGGAVGAGIGRQIREGYRGIANGVARNMFTPIAYDTSHPQPWRHFHYVPDTAYVPGDKIFLFGFSRGAFEARALAAMILTVGILRPENADDYNITRGYKLYKKISHSKNLGTYTPEAYAAELKEFQDLCYPKETTNIHFVGVWDTVVTLGIPPHIKIGPAVSRAMKLLGNDHFDPRRGDMHAITDIPEGVNHFYHALASNETRLPFLPTLGSPSAKHRDPADKDHTHQQLWFDGDHSDIGGGHSWKDVIASGYMRFIPFIWMLKMAMERGLYVDPAFLDAHRELITVSRGRPNSTANAIKAWKLLGIAPRPDVSTTFTVPHERDNPEHTDPTVKVHSSVAYRIAATGHIAPPLLPFLKAHGIDPDMPFDPADHPDVFAAEDGVNSNFYGDSNKTGYYPGGYAPATT